jgi:hypothetical protein
MRRSSLRARPALPAAAALALFCAGLVAACGGGSVAAGTGTLAVTLSRSTATVSTPTVPQVTVTTTEQETVPVTTTETTTQTTSHVPGAIVITPTTTTTDSTSNTETETWALVVIGAAVIGFVVLLIWLARRHGHKEIPAERRRQLLADAVAAWVAQGWAPESQTETTAVLRRGTEHVVIAVDGQGNVSSQAVGAPGPDAPPR